MEINNFEPVRIVPSGDINILRTTRQVCNNIVKERYWLKGIGGEGNNCF